MPTLTFSEEEIQSFANAVKKQLLPALLHELHEHQLPPLLTRKQFMELADIGSSKCNELFNRQDFPVTRELGNPRVPTKLFLEWLYKNTNNIDDVPLKYPYKVYG